MGVNVVDLIVVDVIVVIVASSMAQVQTSEEGTVGDEDSVTCDSVLVPASTPRRKGSTRSKKLHQLFLHFSHWLISYLISLILSPSI